MLEKKTFKEIGPFLGKLEADFFQQANFGITLYTYYSLYRYVPRKIYIPATTSTFWQKNFEV